MTLSPKVHSLLEKNPLVTLICLVILSLLLEERCNTLRNLQCRKMAISEYRRCTSPCTLIALMFLCSSLVAHTPRPYHIIYLVTDPSCQNRQYPILFKPTKVLSLAHPTCYRDQHSNRLGSFRYRTIPPSQFPCFPITNPRIKVVAASQSP
jgi:hypothetical protein